MNILIISPAPKNSRRGNEVTSKRWAHHLKKLGHRVRIAQAFSGQPCDLMLALNAKKSAESVLRTHTERPATKIITMVTGTDIYPDGPNKKTKRVFELADRIVTLQDRAEIHIPKPQRDKVRVIVQSAIAPKNVPDRLKTRFEMTQIGHLRPIKDPFRGAQATRLLPAESRIRLVQLGAPLTAEMEQKANRFSQSLPRFEWLKSLTHGKTLQRLARSQATILSSKFEGGPAVISEAIACGVPVLASRVDGNVGVLGEGYPAFFEYGNTQQLAELMLECESNPKFLKMLRRAIHQMKSRVAPKIEFKLIGQLIRELVD